MPRQKNERIVNFKPITNDFIPKNITVNETISLLPEEVEALYLMDLVELYQEDAAIKMEVSRPTFARILKSGRQKLAQAILNGKNLHLETKEGGYIVAFCCDSKEDYTNIETKGKYICIFTIKEKKVVEKIFIENPAVTVGTKPAVVLPPILLEHSVNYFMTDNIGEGLKNSLLSKGIRIVKGDKFSLDFLK